MIKLISLHGKFTGSAAVETDEKKLTVKLKLRGKAPGEDMTAFLINGDKITCVPLKNGVGEAKASDVRSIIIAENDGNFIAEGVCGTDAAGLYKAKAAVRMMQLPGSPKPLKPIKPAEMKAGAAHTNGAAGIGSAKGIAKGTNGVNGINSGNNPLKTAATEATQKSGLIKNARSAYKTEEHRAEEHRACDNPNPRTKEHFPAGGAQRKSDEAAGEKKRGDREKVCGENGRTNHGDVRIPAGRCNPANHRYRNAAAVTSDILNTAKRLFEIQNSVRNSLSQCPNALQQANAPQNNMAPAACERFPFVTSPANDGESIKNPFPMLFPDSSWKRTGEEGRLAGAANVRGVVYDITAVRSNNRSYPPKGLKGNLRRLQSRDGKFYWLGIRIAEPDPCRLS